VIGEYHKSFASDIADDINLRNDIFGDDNTVLTDRFRGRVNPTSEDFRDFTPRSICATTNDARGSLQYSRRISL